MTFYYEFDTEPITDVLNSANGIAYYEIWRDGDFFMKTIHPYFFDSHEYYDLRISAYEFPVASRVFILGYSIKKACPHCDGSGFLSIIFTKEGKK